MTRKIAIIFNLLVILNQNIIGQSIYFINELNHQIDSLEYIKKCQSEIFKCARYKSDSLTLNKVLFKYSFGKITPTEYNQIKKLLTQQSSIDIDSDEILLINYVDTLSNFEIVRNNYNKHFKNYEGFFRPGSYTKNRYNETNRRWIKSKNKCIKKFKEKYNVSTFYLYKHNFGFKEEFENFNWIKDRGIIKRKFFPLHNTNYYVIIKPNGDYFLCGSHLSDKNLAILLSNSDWSTFKFDLQKSYKSKSKNGIGFFKKETKYHKKHCF
jgi:hypothetical protein